MATTWLAKLIPLFRPEESPRFPEERDQAMTVLRSVERKFTLSLKALLWTVISILLGVIVGQL